MLHLVEAIMVASIIYSTAIAVWAVFLPTNA